MRILEQRVMSQEVADLVGRRDSGTLLVRSRQQQRDGAGHVRRRHGCAVLRDDAVAASAVRAVYRDARCAEVGLLAAVPGRSERGESAHTYRDVGFDRADGDDVFCRAGDADRHLFGIVADELGDRRVGALDPGVDVARTTDGDRLDA